MSILIINTPVLSMCENVINHLPLREEALLWRLNFMKVPKLDDHFLLHNISDILHFFMNITLISYFRQMPSFIYIQPSVCDSKIHYQSYLWILGIYCHEKCLLTRMSQKLISWMLTHKVLHFRMTSSETFEKWLLIDENIFGNIKSQRMFLENMSDLLSAVLADVLAPLCVYTSTSNSMYDILMGPALQCFRASSAKFFTIFTGSSLWYMYETGISIFKCAHYNFS